MKKKITIDIVSDIICPWCYIGKSRLERAIRQVSESVEVKIRMRPFFLYPNIPKGGLPKENFKSPKRPGFKTALKEAGEEENLTFNYKKIDRIPNTLEAHRLMSICTNNEIKNRLGMALFKAYFEDAEDMEDPLILARIARDTGMLKASINQFLTTNAGELEVAAEIQRLKSEGVSAVPSFILNQDLLVVGVQPIHKWVRYFERIT